VGKRGAAVSHSEKELAVVRKATRYSSDTEEFKSISASPEVEDPVVEPEYMDTEGMKYVPESPVFEGLEPTPYCSDTEFLDDAPASPKVEDLEDTLPCSDIEESESRQPSFDSDCSDAKQASPKTEDLEATPDFLDSEYSKSTQNTPDIKVLEATAPESNIKERISISTSPEAEERDATHVSGVAADHVSDTAEPISIPSSPDAEEQDATPVSGDAGDQDTGTKALSDGVYEIEGLRGKQWSAGKLWLKIKWKSLPTPSWELAEHMRNELGENDYQELLETMPRKRRKKAPKW
jgi:hypothetical protein